MFQWLYRLMAGQAQRPDPEPQTQGVAFKRLRRELPPHPGVGLTPQKLAALLAGTETGDLTAQAALAEDMEERDAHLYTELNKRKRALLTLDWDVLPPRIGGARDRKQAAECREWLQNRLDFEDLLLGLANGLLYGYAAIELEWQRREGLWHPTPHDRPPGWFQLDPETRTELRLRSISSYQGEPLRPLGWIIHRHQAKNGYLSRDGLVRVLAWPYLFKNFAVRDFSQLLELHGMPLRVGHYPPFLSDADKDTLWTQLRDLGRDGAALLPDGVAIDFAEVKTTGESYLTLVDWCERSISKAILGQTLSAESRATGLGSGVANLHDAVRWDLISSDARQIAGTLTTQLIAPWLMLNRGLEDPARFPRFVFDLKEVSDLGLYAEALPKLVSIGLPIPTAWASDRLGIPAPANGEPVLTSAPAPLPEETVPAKAGLAVLTAAEPNDPTAPLVDRFGVESEPLLDALLEPVRALLRRSQDLADFQAGLLALYPALDPTAFAALMAQALAVADAAGRLDIIETPS